MVTVFDTRRDRLPEVKHTDLLDEHGKGLGIVAALTAEVGTHPSRSRFGPWLARGKAVWFALDLPQPWCAADGTISPAEAARHLQTVLASRGLDGVT